MGLVRRKTKSKSNPSKHKIKIFASSCQTHPHSPMPVLGSVSVPADIDEYLWQSDVNTCAAAVNICTLGREKGGGWIAKFTVQSPKPKKKKK